MRRTVIKIFILLGVGVSITACVQSSKPISLNKNVNVNPESKERQELTKSQDWVWAGDTGKGAIALKKDGSFWQFGRVEFDWGQISIPLGKNESKHYVYNLTAHKVADGFKDAKIMYGGDTLYAIKKDGTLWVWKQGSYDRFIELSSTGDWLTAGSKWEGNGCNNFEIGLKKDGSIWDLLNDKIKQIGSQNGFTKVAFGCSTIYAQKSDGTIFTSYWKDEMNIDLKKLIKNEKNADVYEKEALLDLAHLKSGVVDNPYVSEIEIREDGTLWLKPEVKIEMVE